MDALKGGKRLHAEGDYGQADSAWRGVQGASCPLRNIANSDKKTDEKQVTAVCPSKKTKRHEIQKFRVVRLQIGVQNRADSGHRQTA